ncbi:DASH family cryptochrome [Cytophaga aurantiaca]|uniref:DASH family cryptochrome n=1 Tax=Cytophaga aurantiaca TaxID=29530 RepID=UPI00037B5A75|nr:DASH family cryptochrome [Cytophaga aurantiaca]
MSKKISIVWFKTDLRLTDNETLLRAIAESDEIIPVYCFDPDHFNKTEFGFQKTGNFRAQFLLESVIALDQALRKKGSGLLVLRGRPEKELLNVIKEYNVKKVYAKKEVAYEEIQKETDVEREIWKLNCIYTKCSTSTLYHAEDLPFSIKDIPDTFTIFKKKTEKETPIRKAFDAPEKIVSPNIPKAKFPSMKELGLQQITIDSRRAMAFKGGEEEACKRLHTYFYETRAIDTYKQTRNGLIGADYSTKFSPWLALGCISPRSVYKELKEYENAYSANESTSWLVFELFWRDYFRFMMKKYHNRFFMQTGIKNNSNYINKHNPDLFYAWINGTCGVDLVDANMIELKRTGFMSNRGRQIVASYLCNDLKLDWRYGAAYFEQQLIDYDVCSNWGNWAYLAGVGNDPRPDRYFNIEKQAKEYDSKSAYRNLWLHE